jgi:hypothetical protein
LAERHHDANNSNDSDSDSYSDYVSFDGIEDEASDNTKEARERGPQLVLETSLSIKMLSRHLNQNTILKMTNDFRRQGDAEGGYSYDGLGLGSSAPLVTKHSAEEDESDNDVVFDGDEELQANST